jgi:aspartyl/asparaginyl beta-hydroxylase (cupin superfamily)
MLSQYITTIFFILIIVIFFLSTVSFSYFYSFNNYHSDNFDTNTNIDNLNYNLDLVSKFSNNQIHFNIIDKPNKNITKYKTFYDSSIFPDLTIIKYNVIKNELMSNLNNLHNIWTDWSELDLWKKQNSVSSWKIIPLMAFGKWSNKYTVLFPETTKLLKNINGLVSAGFSKLGHNTTLTLHKGWANLSNNVLRCHLGIIVPKNKCKLFVMGNSNDVMIQKEGKWIIFDDSLYHSASNEDDNNDRIILLLDIIRPNGIAKGDSDIKDSEELNNFIKEFNKNL